MLGEHRGVRNLGALPRLTEEQILAWADLHHQRTGKWPTENSGPIPDSGGETWLAEMERVCRPGGCVAIVWPNHLEWLAARGYQYVSFPGPMSVEFGSHDDAVELAEIFYPAASGEIRRRGLRRVPFELLGINPPRDLAFKLRAR